LVAIAGAIVGGVIAYVVQIKALRESRKQREEDRRQIKQPQAHALLFKMIQIHSDFFGIQRHFDECFEAASKKNFKGEPWQFVLPLANLPDPIHFSSDEMGMLLALKNDDVFNLVASLDVVLNGLSAAFGTMNSVRRELGQRIKPDAVVGHVFTGTTRSFWLCVR
jgi:hypothetical protein